MGDCLVFFLGTLRKCSLLCHTCLARRSLTHFSGDGIRERNEWRLISESTAASAEEKVARREGETQSGIRSPG
jgi:hypothetical protein